MRNDVAGLVTPTTERSAPGSFIALTKDTSDESTGLSSSLEELNEEDCGIELLAKGLLPKGWVLEDKRLSNFWNHHMSGVPKLDYSTVRRELSEQHSGAPAAWTKGTPSASTGARLFAPLPQRSPRMTQESIRTRAYSADDECSLKTLDNSRGTSLQPSETPVNSTQTPIAMESARELIAQGIPKFALALEVTTRYCVFNIGHISKSGFWDVLKSRLSPEILDGVIRVENVCQPNGRKRMDMWVASRVASRIKTALYLDANARRNGVTTCFAYPMRRLEGIWLPNKATRHWRIDVYRSKRDRDLTPRPIQCLRMEEPRRAIATFNINGIWNRKIAVENFLKKFDIGIFAVQETLIDCNQYALRFPGYEVYERSKTKNFRGQALAIHRSYTSYEVGKAEHDSLIHVRVVGLTTGTPWHVIAVYMPSGGNYRSSKTACFGQLLNEVKAILDKEPLARIVILGDFNEKREALRRRIKEEKTGLSILPIRGSKATFHRNRRPEKWSDIDSIVVSTTAAEQLSHGRVQRNWGVNKASDSDHFPLLATLSQEIDRIQIAPPVRFRYDVDLVKGHGHKLVFSNRWSSLSVEPILNTDDLDVAADKFTDVINLEAMDTGIKQVVQEKVYTFHRKLKAAIVKTSNARKEWLFACRKQPEKAAALGLEYQTLRDTTRALIRAKEKRLRSKDAARVAKLFRDNEMRAFHRWEAKNAINGASNASKVTPVRDNHGVLHTDKAAILEQTTAYFKNLSQDDPLHLSQNAEHWRGRVDARRTIPLDCNKAIEWREVLDAIRRMALGTAPGNDDIPIEVYKAMLKEECHAHCRNQGHEIGDGIYVALPLLSLPADPCTPMGTQLKRVIDGIWETEHQPKSWSTVTNISLHKSGDPTDLQNYRGISLIVVAMKIFTVILSMRISKLAELDHLFIKEQGGFREGQEAVAQFIALSEIARRRRLKGKNTWAVFIDFKKAFDKVMHEALFEKMDAMGFRGRFLNVIKNIYRTSKARTRVGGVLGEVYDMLRGTRQGCPLSPILFLLFINDFLAYVPAGVEIPLVGPPHQGGIERTAEEDAEAIPDRCAGLLFADDIAGLAETEEQAREFLEGVTNWSRDWHMPMGAQKCGVMLIGGTEAEQLELVEKYFEVDGQRVMGVRKYKYLGIWISDKLGDNDATDEIAHCRALAQKVKQATDMRRGFLRDRKIPIALKVAVVVSKILSVGCYGGEWIAMCQRRTDIIQKELNVALKLILGSSTKSNLHAVKPLSLELGIPTIEERTTEMRLRLWQKCPVLKTWLHSLSVKENRFRGRIKVWTTGTQSLLRRLQPNLAYRGLEREKLDSRVREMKESRGKYTYMDTPIRRNETFPKRLREEAQVAITARALYSDLYVKKTKSTTDYVSFGFDRTRKYLQSAVYLPSLTEGTVWLARIRTGGWWTTKRRFDVLKLRGNNHLQDTVCPCCGDEFRTNEAEIIHILLDCRKWDKERNLLLRPIIHAFLDTDSWVNHGRLAPADWRLETAMRLLGASFFTSDHMPLYKDSPDDSRRGDFGIHDQVDDVRKDDIELQGAPSPLDRYAIGWGGSGEVHLPGLGAHGYTCVASFLAQIMPRHKAELFPNGNESHPTAYQTTECEESPVKRPLPKSRLCQTDDSRSSRSSDADTGAEFESIVYPQGRLSSAIQANALRGMGTRSKHALKCISRCLPCSDSDEYSVGCAPHCHEECAPRLFVP